MYRKLLEVDKLHQSCPLIHRGGGVQSQDRGKYMNWHLCHIYKTLLGNNINHGSWVLTPNLIYCINYLVQKKRVVILLFLGLSQILWGRREYGWKDKSDTHFPLIFPAAVFTQTGKVNLIDKREEKEKTSKSSRQRRQSAPENKCMLSSNKPTRVKSGGNNQPINLKNLQMVVVFQKRNTRHVVVFWLALLWYNKQDTLFYC